MRKQNEIYPPRGGEYHDPVRDAARRQFIEKYGPLALATPAALYALMSPRRAQAQITSNTGASCAVGQVYGSGGSCTALNGTFSVNADGTAQLVIPAGQSFAGTHSSNIAAHNGRGRLAIGMFLVTENNANGDESAFGGGNGNWTIEGL